MCGDARISVRGPAYFSQTALNFKKKVEITIHDSYGQLMCVNTPDDIPRIDGFWRIKKPT